MITDVDGTLLTPEKVLTLRASAAVRGLAAAGIGFTLVSSRPARAMMSLIAALDLKLPFAAFNGGAVVNTNLSMIETHRLDPGAASTMLDLLTRRGVDAWVFADNDWRLRNAHGAYVVDNQRTLGYPPVIVQGFDDVISRIDKIVGVSGRPALLVEVAAEARTMLPGQATINLSRPCYLDVTHPEANKGDAVKALCKILGVDLDRTAVLGDMMNDIAMFDVAGLAIAMGQSPDIVKAHAQVITGANTEDGFANGIERIIRSRVSRSAHHY